MKASAAHERFVADVEAAVERLASEAQVSSPSRNEEAGQLHDRQTRVIDIICALLPFAQRALRAKEVLEGALSCSLTQQTFCEPVLAPDGQVYEKSWIVGWLELKPQSPSAKIPMRPSDLIRDRVAEQAVDALWLLRGEERPTNQVPEPCPAVRDAQHGAVSEVQPPLPTRETSRAQAGLREAITEGDEARALELLRQPQSLDGLNDRIGEESATLLHIALLNGLPAAALAIAENPCFTGHHALMGGPLQMVTPIHIAAALGLRPVCEALIQRCGGGIAVDSVPRHVTLHLKSGGTLHLKSGDDAMGMASSYGHRELERFLDNAVELFMEAW